MPRVILKFKNTKPKTEKKIKNDFQTILTQFEKNHAKIINKSIFVKSDADQHIVMSKTKLITSYEHINFTQKIKNEEKQKTFISKWLK